MFIHGNLKILRTRKGRSQQEVADALNITRSKIAGYETTINPSIDGLIQFSEYFNVSIDILVKIDLSKMSDYNLRQLERGSDSYVDGHKLRILATTIDRNNRELIEMVPIKAKASYLAGFADPEFISELPMLDLPMLDHNKKHRVFQIDGDSMLPIISGSYIVTEYIENWNLAKDGEKYIVVTENDGVVFKLIYNKIAENQSLLLCSTNPLYPPFEVNVNETKEVWKYVLTISA